MRWRQKTLLLSAKMVAMTATVFSEWLTRAIYSRRWGPSDLARHAGVSPTAVQKWLSGASTPYAKTCYAIAEALGVSVDEVLELAGHKPATRLKEEPERNTPGETGRPTPEEDADRDRILQRMEQTIQKLMDDFNQLKKGSA